MRRINKPMATDLDFDSVLARAGEIAKHYGYTKSRTNLQAKLAHLSAKFFNAPQNQTREDLVNQMAECLIGMLQVVHHLDGAELFKEKVLQRLDWQEAQVIRDIENGMKGAVR